MSIIVLMHKIKLTMVFSKSFL